MCGVIVSTCGWGGGVHHRRFIISLGADIDSCAARTCQFKEVSRELTMMRMLDVAGRFGGEDEIVRKK